MPITPLPPVDPPAYDPSDPSNINPAQQGYTGQQPFRFWCQKVMPLVYDDSLSYYELLCKVVNYLNNVIADIGAMESNIQALDAGFEQLQTYVNNNIKAISDYINSTVTTLTDYINNYFSSLDVQQEINNKLDEMVANGTFAAIITPIIKTQVKQDVTDWLEENVEPVGSAVVLDKTLSIEGAAADAKATGIQYMVFRPIPETKDFNLLEESGSYLIGNLNDWQNAPDANATGILTVLEGTNQTYQNKFFLQIYSVTSTVIDNAFPKVYMRTGNHYGTTNLFSQWQRIPIVDATLSYSGFAADAKETGKQYKIYLPPPASKDFNDLTASGTYLVSGFGSWVNGPNANAGGICTVLKGVNSTGTDEFLLQVYTVTSNNVIQNTPAKVWLRSGTNYPSGWIFSEWFRLPYVDPSLSIPGAAADASMTGKQYQIFRDIPQTKDFNLLEDSGSYLIGNLNDWQNAPDANATGVLTVLEGTNSTYQNKFFLQIYYVTSTVINNAFPKVYMRCCNHYGTTNMFSQWMRVPIIDPTFSYSGFAADAKETGKQYRIYLAPPASKDFNDLTGSGNYIISGFSTWANGPVEAQAGGICTVFKGVNSTETDEFLLQVYTVTSASAIDNKQPKVYVRSATNYPDGYVFSKWLRIPGIDPDLTVEGYAADAKATGIQYKINRPAPASKDFNELLESGSYLVTGIGNWQNAPDTTFAGMLSVFVGTNNDYTDKFILQVYSITDQNRIGYQLPMVFYRCGTNYPSAVVFSPWASFTPTISTLHEQMNTIVNGASVNGKKFCFAGDSITLGQIAGGTITGENWVNKFSSIVNASMITNIAVSGAGFTTAPSSQVITQLQSHTLEEDILFIAAGVNDFRHGVSLENFGTAFQEVIDWCKTNATGKRVIFITPINPTGHVASETRPLQAYRQVMFEKVLMAGYEVICGEQMPFPDRSSTFSQAMLGDGLHPTPLGYTIYANFVSQYVR